MMLGMKVWVKKDVKKDRKERNGERLLTTKVWIEGKWWRLIGVHINNFILDNN